MKSQKTEIEESTVKSSRATPRVAPTQIEEQQPVEAISPAGRGQAVALTMDEPVETFDRSMVGVTACPRPAREAFDAYEDGDENRFAGTASLAVVLGQLVAYFSGRADVDDLDVLSFSLHHLFCRVDFLYRKALPALTEWMKSTSNGHNDVRSRQQTWSQLQTINRTLDRMEPLCHLLSDATECILDTFDITSETTQPRENGPQCPPISCTPDRVSVQQGSPLQDEQIPIDEQDWLHMVDQERWQQALTAITESLLSWEEHYRPSVSFAAQFSDLFTIAPSLSQLDNAFATLLDSAGAIFGDILPGFHTIQAADDATTAALLFDLMQQSDRLLVQFETTLEPMNTLIKHYSVAMAAI